MTEPEAPRVPAWACAIERGMTAAETGIVAVLPTAGKLFVAAVVVGYHIVIAFAAIDPTISLRALCAMAVMAVIMDLFVVTIAATFVPDERYGKGWDDRARRQRAGNLRPGEEPMPRWVLAAERYMAALDWCCATLVVPLIVISVASLLVMFNLVFIAAIDPNGAVSTLLGLTSAEPAPLWMKVLGAAGVIGVDILVAYVVVNLGFERVFGGSWRERCRRHREKEERA